MRRRRSVLVLPLGVLVAACGIGSAPPTILGGAPDTSASALAERREALAERVDEVETSAPATGEEGTDVPPVDPADDDATARVLLIQQGEPVWVGRPPQEGAPDLVFGALGALAGPLRPPEAQLGLTTAVPLGTTVRGWNRRGDRLELGVDGAAFSGGTTTALRQRAVQLACTAGAVLDPPPAGVDFVTGAPLGSVEAQDCPPLPGG